MLTLCTTLLIASAAGPLAAIAPDPSAPVPPLAASASAATPLAPDAAEPQVDPEPIFDPSAVLPYFSDTDRRKAVEELLAGHAAAALKLLPKAPVDSPTRFVRAQALALSGDNAAAASEFDALSGTYPALAARCHCLAAVAFEAKPGDAPDDLSKAATHWLACSADPTRVRSAPLAAAKLLVKLNRKEEALAALTPLFGVTGWGRAEALLLTGQIQESLSHRKEAIEAYRTAYLEEPNSPATEKAKEALRAIAKIDKSAIVPPALALDRIDRLLTAKQVNRAIHELEELHQKPVCTGDSCKPARCQAEGETKEEEATQTDGAAEVIADADPADAAHDAEMALAVPSARKARPFSLAKANDDEDAAPILPTCSIAEPKKPADPLACRAQLLRGEADSHQKGVRVRALASLRMVYAHCADPDVRARALFYGQNIAARVGDSDAYDLAMIDALQFPTNAFADDALLGAAETARQAGDGKAERVALRALAKKYKDSDLRAEALFRLFWSHRAEGRPDRGLQYLDILSAEYENGAKGDGGDAERGRYWWGRTVAADAIKADRPRGVEMLAQLGRQRPTTYYGMLARSFVASIDPKNVVAPIAAMPYPGLLRLGKLTEDRAFTEGLEFWRIGEPKDSRDLMVAVNYKALREDGARGEEATLVVAEMLQRLGDDRMAHSVARRELLKIIREGTNPLGRRAAMVCYPLAFRMSVSDHAKEEGFAPDFLQGLMREESALDPMARSPVGALGLTQLMPQTAIQVAKGAGIRGFTLGSLSTPDVNIHLGSIYLGKMLKQFGHPGLAAAAYNAGPGAVAHWLANAHGAFDEFVEQIPFAETRGYVKRVLRSYAAYSYLYEHTDDKALCVSLKLPATATAQK